MIPGGWSIIRNYRKYSVSQFNWTLFDPSIFCGCMEDEEQGNKISCKWCWGSCGTKVDSADALVLSTKWTWVPRGLLFLLRSSFLCLSSTFAYKVIREERKGREARRAQSVPGTFRLCEDTNVVGNLIISVVCYNSIWKQFLRNLSSAFFPRLWARHLLLLLKQDFILK